MGGRFPACRRHLRLCPLRDSIIFPHAGVREAGAALNFVLLHVLTVSTPRVSMFHGPARLAIGPIS